MSMCRAATSALSATERSYPTPEVKGRCREDPMPKGRRPIGATPPLRSGAARRSHLMSEARGCGREEQFHIQGAVAAQAQEGLEELSHVEGQEGMW